MSCSGTPSSTREAPRAECSARLRAVSERTPNIGVTCNVEEVRYGGLWTEPAAMVPLTYVRAIARAGGRPLLLAPTPADLADPAELLDLLDGVLVTGGADLDPGTYGAPPHPETGPTSADRDAFELLLVRPPPSATSRAWASAAACRSSTSPTAARSTAPARPPRARHPPRRGRRLR